MEPTVYQYNDGRLPGGRHPRLYLAKGAEVVKFNGADIPGWCIIQKDEYSQCGKWSNHDYELLLAPGVRPIEMVSPLHGRYGQWWRTWSAAAEELQLPVEKVQEIIRKEYWETADRLDKVEAFMEEMHKTDQDMEIVLISFGSPTCRQMREGWWTSPKESRTSTGVKVVVEPDPNKGWYAPKAVEPEGAKVVGHHHRPGYHGGHWVIEVAVPLTPKEE